MIFNSQWIPQSDNEYQQRLLATTILLVKSAGGRLVIPRATIESVAGVGTMLHQEVDTATGDVILSVTAHKIPEDKVQS